MGQRETRVSKKLTKEFNYSTLLYTYSQPLLKGLERLARIGYYRSCALKILKEIVL